MIVSVSLHRIIFCLPSTSFPSLPSTFRISLSHFLLRAVVDVCEQISNHFGVFVWEWFDLLEYQTAMISMINFCLIWMQLCLVTGFVAKTLCYKLSISSQLSLTRNKHKIRCRSSIFHHPFYCTKNATASCATLPCVWFHFRTDPCLCSIWFIINKHWVSPEE